MSKITLNNVGSLIDATTAASTINGNTSTIQVAFDNTLSRDGTSPNQMGSDLDMNSNQIVNLPAPISNNSPLRLQDLQDFIGGGTVSGLPSGGVTGQVLAKNSNTNYDVKWSNSVTSVGLALPSDFTITNSPVTTTGTLTGNWTLTPTGTGSIVRSTSPTLVSPNIGFATGTSLNLTGLTASSGLATDASKNLISLVNTGTGNNVLATSPTLVTPILGTPTSGNLINCTALPVTSVTGLSSGIPLFLSAASSANLAAAMTDETGSGLLVFATSPTLVTPALGTPSAVVLTNATGTAAGLTAGNVTTNANLTGVVTSVGNATSLGSFTSTNLRTALTDETGTGSAVFATSPTLVTPILGTPSSVTLTSATGLPISTGLTGAGTGVLTALGINVGTAGSFVVNGGALGTPSSGVGTNITGVNAATLNSATFAAPGAIGGGTASTGAFTGVTANTINTGGGNLSIGNTSTIVSLVGTTAATSTTTGALTVAGGFGAAGKGFFGDDLTTRDVLASRTASTGYLFLGSNGVHFIGYDGTGYSMPSGGLTIGGTLSSTTAPTAVSGAGPILTGSGSTINSRMKVNLNGTDYWIPCSTTAF